VAMKQPALWIRTGFLLSREQTRALKEQARRLGYLSLSRYVRCIVNAELRAPRVPSARSYIGRSPRTIALSRPKSRAVLEPDR
jgi:hypothetical protein